MKRERTDVLRSHQVSVGQAPVSFIAVAEDGTAVGGPVGLTLVGFFCAGCPACSARIAPFTAYVRANRIARDDVLTILLLGDEGPPPYLDRLAEVALVSVQPPGNLIGEAFGVDGYPAFCLLDGVGTVVATGADPAALPAPLTA
ncbi:MAG TPA: hypothetical protein VKU39_18455 [Streptosporangiaceae bacterium]|nr:hypothetical protein [Streptosporangiaceae bacterium]